jgi:hypothetical protein
LTEANEALAKAGFPRKVLDFDAHSVEWGDLDTTPEVPTPAGVEQIRAAYLAPHPHGPQQIILENGEGALWQATEIGLAHVAANHDERATWAAFADLHAYLPASVNSRPTAKSKTWRSDFNYDLAFSTGVTLRLELLPGAPHVTFEILRKKKEAK